MCCSLRSGYKLQSQVPRKILLKKKTTKTYLIKFYVFTEKKIMSSNQYRISSIDAIIDIAHTSI